MNGDGFKLDDDELTEFIIGDKVRLLNDGPLMVVESVELNEGDVVTHVTCLWFRKTGGDRQYWEGPHRQRFPVNVLMHDGEVA